MKDLLRFLTCGSVDDGKSTLIGHLLYEANLLYTDQKEKVENNDYASLLDGLSAEQEQGITIDVAYRYFSTAKRSFIVADTPGHEQYTRNMAVGASFADLAILLVDASHGLKIQTYRHARICRLMGIKHFIFVLNKMDLINYGKDIFVSLSKQIEKLCKQLNIENHIVIPISATNGDNIVSKSEITSWYDGPTLLNYLEEVEIRKDNYDDSFIMPVQRVCRPDSFSRYYEGKVCNGIIKTNDKVIVLPQKEETTINEILVAGKKAAEANNGDSISIALNDELDISRGDVIVNNDCLNENDNFVSKIVWLSQEELSTSKNYYLKLASQNVSIRISQILSLENIETGKLYEDNKVKRNDIALVEILANKKIIISEFDKYPTMGRFLLIDRISNETVACGVITDTNSNARNLTYYETQIDKQARAISLKQKPLTIWMTGLSASGKSTLASEIEKRLHESGKHTMLLDGDNIRLGLNKDLHFTLEDRSENIRRIAEVSKLMNDAGLIVITAFISPLHMDRKTAKEIIGDSFYEIYVSTPIEVCKKRDTKGLYEKAIKGEIKEFTGISSPYEIPKKPDFSIDMSDISIEDAAKMIINDLLKKI